VPTDLSPTIEDWLLIHSRSEHTERTYRAGIRPWLRWLNAEGLTPVEATPQDATRWIRSMETATPPQAPATIARKVSTAASLHRYLIQAEERADSPFTLTQRPVVDPEIGGYAALAPRQVEALLASAEAAGASTHVAVTLLVHTAIRASELVGARVEGLHDVQDRDGGWHLALTVRRKGGRPDEVAIPDRVAHDVDALRQDRSHGPLLARAGKADAPWTYWMLNKAVKAAGAAAHLDVTVTPHMLRATWATHAIDHGVPLAHVQDVMGHSSPVTTRRYDKGQWSIHRKIDAVEAVAAAFRGGGGGAS
jgi:integrase/recombinase XerD